MIDVSAADVEQETTQERSRDFNQSLSRGLEIIESFGADATRQTVSEVAAKTGLTRATARRFLITLVELGYMSTDGRTFALAPRVLGLGYSFLSGLGFPTVALPHLERLVAEVDESSEGSILDGQDVVYVARVPGPKLMTLAVNVGSRLPAHATSMGRVLLSGLPDQELDAYLAKATLNQIMPNTTTDKDELRRRIVKARTDGFALVDQEIEEGLVAVAVPIHDRLGRVVGAINLSTHVGRYDAESLVRDLLPPLQRCGNLIEQDLANVV